EALKYWDDEKGDFRRSDFWTAVRHDITRAFFIDENGRTLS
ncbi:hypothetical protein AVEN_122271-1, partial [Araneus ventricosus]